MMNLAPIVLFVYNRPWHTRQTVEALQRCELASESELYIFTDGPKPNATEECRAKIEKVRDYIHTIEGFKATHIEKSPTNKGLANSVIDGVTKIIKMYGKVIVLEDDLIVSHFFLNFMNEALNKYEDCERVSAVSAFVNPTQKEFCEPFFLRYFSCWGWGTWKRGWDLFCANASELAQKIKSTKDIYNFNIGNTVDFLDMLHCQARGGIDSWAIRFYASSFIANKLILYPPKSLVIQEGICFGTHSNSSANLLQRDVKFNEMRLCDTPIQLDNIPIKPSKYAFYQYKKFYGIDPHFEIKNRYSRKTKIMKKTKSLLRILLSKIIDKKPL